MIKKKVSFVSVNFRQGPVEINAYFLPYSVGVLWAYSNSLPEVSCQWELDQLVWKRDDIEQVAQRLAQNHLVGFSTYIWNRHYNYALAKRIKEINPRVVTVFGGPEPAITDPDIFLKHSYIDLVSINEGEITFSKIFQAYDARAWSTVAGLLINRDGVVEQTGPAERIQDLATLPSPYLTGLFDNIVNNNQGYSWNATIETNRGCPYQCTFCDWGSLTYNKVKLFPLDRVYAEIDWIADNADFMYLADANFGMFVERDRNIVEHIITSQKRTNNHYFFYTNWAKNQKAEVFEMIDRLASETKCVTNGLSVSVQTMTAGVLDIIKRSNLNQHKLNEIFELGQKNNTPVYTDLILGLPGETLTSWKHSLYQVFEAGNHHGIDIIQCQLLENAEMNLSQKSIYKMKTKEVIDYMSQATDKDQGPAETIAIVTETNSMPKQDMLEAQVWSSFMQVFHMSGFSSQISRYLRKSHNVSYKDFYEGLYDFAKTDHYVSSRLELLKQHYNSWMENGFLPHPITKEVSQTGVNLITSLLLLIHIEKQIDHVHDLVEKYVSQAFDIIDTNIQNTLFQYQRSMVIRYDYLESFPKTVNFDFDIHGYLNKDSNINQPCQLTLDISEGDTKISFVKFHENLYYGRKRGFGRAYVTAS